MPNYNLVVTAKYRPYTFDEMAKPFLMYKTEYDKQVEKADALSLEAAKRLKFLDPVLDKDVYDQYMQTADEVNAIGNELATSGLNSSLLERAKAARNNLQTIVAPLDYALQQREKEKEIYTKMRLEHPEVLINRDPFATKISDYYPGTGLKSFQTISLKDVYQQAMLRSAAFAKQFSKSDMKRLNNLYYEYIHTVGLQGDPAKVMEKYKEFGQMQKALEDSIDMSQFSPGQQEEIRKKILTGIQDGIVSSYEEKNRTPVKDDVALLRIKQNMELDKLREKARLSGSSKNGGSGNGKKTLPTLPYNTEGADWDRSNKKETNNARETLEKDLKPDSQGYVPIDFRNTQYPAIFELAKGSKSSWVDLTLGAVPKSHLGKIKLYKKVTENNYDGGSPIMKINGEYKSVKPEDYDSYTTTTDYKLLSEQEFINENSKVLEDFTGRKAGAKEKEQLQQLYWDIFRKVNKVNGINKTNPDGTLDTKTYGEMMGELPDKESSPIVEENLLKVKVSNPDAVVKYLVEGHMSDDMTDVSNSGIRKITGAEVLPSQRVKYEYKDNESVDWEDFFDSKGKFKKGWRIQFSTKADTPTLILRKGRIAYGMQLDALGNTPVGRYLNPTTMNTYNMLEGTYGKGVVNLTPEEEQNCENCYHALNNPNLYTKAEQTQAYNYLNSIKPGTGMTYKSLYEEQKLGENNDESFYIMQSDMAKELEGYIKKVGFQNSPTAKERAALEGEVESTAMDGTEWIDEEALADFIASLED